MRYYEMHDPILGARYHRWDTLEKRATSVSQPPYCLNNSDIAKFKEMEAQGQTVARGGSFGDIKYRITDE